MVLVRRNGRLTGGEHPFDAMQRIEWNDVATATNERSAETTSTRKDSIFRLE